MPHRTDILLDLGAPFEARYRHFIGGDFTAPADGSYRPVYSPINAAPICEVASASPADRERAALAAGKALSGWRGLPAAHRAEMLRNFADYLDSELEILAMAESWDSGKPVRDLMTDELPLAIDRLRDCAAASEVPADDEPVPAVRSINCSTAFPLLSLLWQAAPALAAGDTLVIGTAPATPASAFLLADSIAATLPAGVVNIVAGGASGKAPPLHSVPATNLYLSGIAEDGPLLDRAVESLSAFVFNRGDILAGPRHALIAEEIYETLVSRLLETLAELTPENPLNPSTRIGAQPTASAVSAMRAHHGESLAAGGELVAGGDGAMPALSAALAEGYFATPTVLRARAMQDLVPAAAPLPHLTLISVGSADEAVSLLPASLEAIGLWTDPSDPAPAFAEHTSVWTNRLAASPCHMALGIGRPSGIGPKEQHDATGQHAGVNSRLSADC